jgi:translation initiation factor 2 alpha subunit (eIF-2alpha)
MKRIIKQIGIVFLMATLAASCATNEEDPVADTSAPTSPTITTPSSTAGLNVTLTLSATDDVGVVAYYLSASSTTPSSSSTSWVDVSSAVTYSGTVSYTLTTTSGNYEYVYAWFKDAAGNVSSTYKSDGVSFMPQYTMSRHLLRVPVSQSMAVLPAPITPV